MSQQLESYSETRRDQLEDQLAAESNKREINYRKSNGITVIAYWLRKQNICTIWLQDERTDSATEFAVPNDEVMEWFNHPYAHPDAIITPYEQRENGDGA